MFEKGDYIKLYHWSMFEKGDYIKLYHFSHMNFTMSAPHTKFSTLYLSLAKHDSCVQLLNNAILN